MAPSVYAHAIAACGCTLCPPGSPSDSSYRNEGARPLALRGAGRLVSRIAKMRPTGPKVSRGTGENNAARNDRTGSNGRRHGAAAGGQGARVHRPRRPAGRGCADAQAGLRRRGHIARTGRQADPAARDLADGAGRRGRPGAQGPGGPPGRRRHRHRRRQLLLPRRHPARQGTGRGGAALSRHRHQRRRCRDGPRLLPDDRRRGEDRGAARADLPGAGAGRCRRRRARPGARARSTASRKGSCTADHTAPATSSRWSTTGSNTASWRPTPKG